MSESSSAASTSDYDVFINHRGPDVKKNFASHLYRRLLSYRLRTFLDQPELERGDYFDSQIKNAIRSASVHVAIFSSTYAESVWCLNELLLMLESEAPIIPVFYDVKPHELRWTWGKDGQYGQAIHRLEKKMKYDPQTHEEKLRHDSATIENWRKALSCVAGISGFELDACNGDEGELVDVVVQQVLKKVKKPALNVAKYPIGLDDKVRDFENTVMLQRQQSGKPRILGIVGLGGVGKTTLAKEFFNRKSSDYSRTCFLADVRDNASKSCLISLQKKLLRSLNVSDHIDGVDEGIGMLSKHLSSSRALIILDDVDHLNQVDALLPNQIVHSDSLVVITCRDKDVLTRSKVENTSIYKLTGLNAEHSRELFCSHAFNQPYPPPGFESVVLEFLESCNGLPLSLKVFGALLYGKNITAWGDELESLRQILPTDIQQSFKISYNSLNREEQQIFLDIACFFRGQNMDRSIRIWDGSSWQGKRWQGRRGFETLRNKCLVEVDSENNIQIHDHLRDMGREIAEEPGLPRRIWRWTNSATEPLLQQSLNGQVIPVRGIRMVYNDIDDDDALSCIPMMMGLQLLDTEDVLLERILTKVQRPNLIWLRWGDCPQSSLPSSISMKDLRVLQLQRCKNSVTKLETLWERESQAPLQLRELEVDAPLSNIPESIGKLKHLERIELNLNGSNLTKVPQEFCLLQSLKALVIRGCSKMKSLPECFGNLTNLLHIDLSICSKLDTLPDSFGNLTNLRHIDLSWCANLNSLPYSFGNLTSLRHINLSRCYELDTLPHSFGKLIKLQYLDLEECSNLTMSSETLGNISTLEYVNLHLCGKIEVFPPQVAHQRSLEQLRFGGTNLNIKELPSAIGELNNLEVLQIGGPLLDTLPLSLCHLKNLKELGLVLCEQLKCLPASLGDLRNLKKLEINGSRELKCLPNSIGQLTQLTELCIESCPLIRELPFIQEVKGERETLSDMDSSIDYGILTQLQQLQVHQTGISEVSFAEGICCNLRHLYIEDCNNVVEVGLLPNTLIELSFVSCHNLRKIDQIHGLAKLQELNISDCTELEELPRIETLVSLRELYARDCEKLKSIRVMGQLTNLQFLDVDGCSELEEVEGIQHCISLERLNVCRCVKLKSIQGLGQLAKLRELDVTDSSELEEVEGLQHCISLEKLVVGGCVKLKSIQGLGQLSKLRELNVTDCSELEDVEGIQHCISLERLDAGRCVKLKSIRCLGQLAKLLELDVTDCSELEEVEGIQHCMSLKWLSVGGCPKLQWSAEVKEQLQKKSILM